MTFEQWWIETVEPKFKEAPHILMLSYKEVAEWAWNAGFIEGKEEEGSYK
jgi:hypothetical protein